MNTNSGIEGVNTPKAKAIYSGMTTLDRTHKKMKHGGEPLEVVAKVIMARERLRDEYLHEIKQEDWPR